MFYITHNDAPRSVGRLWTCDQPVAQNTTWQHTTHTTDIHPCPGCIRTHNFSRRAATDLRLRPNGHLDRIYSNVTGLIHKEILRGELNW